MTLAVVILTGCLQPTASTTSPSPSPPRSASASPSVSATPTPRASPPNLPLYGRIQVPAGFRPYLYAQGLTTPTAMAFGPDGRLYVVGQAGTIAVVTQPGAPPQTLVSGLPTTLGLAWRDTDLFVSVRGSILAYHLQGGQLTGGTAVVRGLPTGRHQNDAILLLPDGDFLVGLGSTCDACGESDPRSASVLRFHPDWSFDTIVVAHARNPYGLALRSSDGSAFVTINGQDNLGSQPADHLLRVFDGEDAGWPRCWPAYPDGSLHGSCSGVARPIAVFTPHSSADGMVFYEAGQFGPEFYENAFVAEWGANAGGSIGRRLERVVLTGSGSNEQGSVTDFATGFSHALAVAVTPDGGLLVGDYGTGSIVEIWNG